MPTDAPKTALVADADGRGDRIRRDQPSDDAIRALFGRQARRGYYDLLPTLGGLGSRSPIRRRMVAKLGLRTDDRVLDIACGTGLGFAALESALGPDGEIVGVDFTPEMLARAARRTARRGWSNVRLVEADARTLPFGDGAFAGVCSTLALGGSDWQRLLHEALRVLAPRWAHRDDRRHAASRSLEAGRATAGGVRAPRRRLGAAPTTGRTGSRSARRARHRRVGPRRALGDLRRPKAALALAAAHRRHHYSHHHHAGNDREQRCQPSSAGEEDDTDQDHRRAHRQVLEVMFHAPKTSGVLLRRIGEIIRLPCGGLRM